MQHPGVDIREAQLISLVHTNMDEQNVDPVVAPEEVQTDTQVEAEAAPDADTVPAEEVAPAPVEEIIPDPAEEAVADDAAPSDDRDPSVAVSVEEELTEEARKARINYLVEHPDERTAHDPFPADGDRV